MILTLSRQESYSRSHLLLRSLFGWLYIGFPHVFLLSFAWLWSSVLNIIKIWTLLFLGRIPESIYLFQKNLWRWEFRLHTSLLNLTDDYPTIGLRGDNPHTTLDFENPERISRFKVIIRALFGFIYVTLPHGIVLYFFGIAISFVSIIAWWIILFTGKFPEGMFDFNTRYIRWSYRVRLYMSYYTDEYPPFNGLE